MTRRRSEASVSVVVIDDLRCVSDACCSMLLTVNGGINDDTSSCTSDAVMSLQATSDDSFLSSYTSAMYEHGTARCPWHITAAPGQHVELYVLDFSLSARYRAVWGHTARDTDDAVTGLEYCHMYATVTEREPSQATESDRTICASNARETLVYTSQTNSVIVQVSSHAVQDPSANFLIKFKGSNILYSILAADRFD